MHHQPIPAGAADPLPGYEPVELRARHDGWTAERQRIFLSALGETGCISEACRQTGITARSAYRLRGHPAGKRFAEAWDQALRQATAKLMTLAYERAIRGTATEQWRDGKLVAETRTPSDKLLMFLLANLAPWNHEPSTRWARLHATAGVAADALAPMLEELEDCAVPCEQLSRIDFAGQPPIHADLLSAPFDEDD